MNHPNRSSVNRIVPVVLNERTVYIGLDDGMGYAVKNKDGSIIRLTASHREAHDFCADRGWTVDCGIVHDDEPA